MHITTLHISLKIRLYIHNNFSFFFFPLKNHSTISILLNWKVATTIEVSYLYDSIHTNDKACMSKTNRLIHSKALVVFVSILEKHVSMIL